MAVAAAAAAALAVGFALGWPYGFIAAAGCLLLPFAVVRLLLHLFPPVVRRARQPLRVVAVRLADPADSITPPSRPAITERKP